MKSYYTENYCICKEWEVANHKDRNAILAQYPSQCPYCHAELKNRSTLDTVRVLITFTNASPFACPIEIPLSELKEILEAI